MAVRPNSHGLNAVLFWKRPTRKSRTRILNDVGAHPGEHHRLRADLRGAAEREHAQAEERGDDATAIAAPITPLWPPMAALSTTMTVAATAVTAADRRAIGAMFASIFWKAPDDL